MDLGMLIATLALTISYQLLGKSYAMQNFDLTFTLLYRAVILPLFLFYLGRVIVKCLLAKRLPAIFSRKSCRLLCVLIWALHFGCSVFAMELSRRPWHYLPVDIFAGGPWQPAV